MRRQNEHDQFFFRPRLPLAQESSFGSDTQALERVIPVGDLSAVPNRIGKANCLPLQTLQMMFLGAELWSFSNSFRQDFLAVAIPHDEVLQLLANGSLPDHHPPPMRREFTRDFPSSVIWIARNPTGTSTRGECDAPAVRRDGETPTRLELGKERFRTPDWPTTLTLSMIRDERLSSTRLFFCGNCSASPCHRLIRRPCQ